MIKMFDDPSSWSYRFAQANIGGDYRPEFQDGDRWPAALIAAMRRGQQRKRGPFGLKLHRFRYERIEVHRVTYELNGLNLSDAQEQIEYGPRKGACFRRVKDEILDRDGTVRRYPELIAHWGYPYDAKTGKSSYPGRRGSIPRPRKKE